MDSFDAENYFFVSLKQEVIALFKYCIVLWG